MYDQAEDEPQGEDPQLLETYLTFPKVTVHSWKHRGEEIYCVSCEQPHGFTLRVGQHMVGVKDGQPVIATLFDIPSEGNPSEELSSSGDDKSL